MKRARVDLVVVTLAFAAAGLHAAYDWASVYEWLHLDLPKSAAATIDFACPGMRAAVDWIHARGLQRVRTLPYESDPYRYQRLMEMLFPIRLDPGEPQVLRSGEIVVIGPQAQLPMAADELLDTGQLKIVQVR